MRRKFSSAEAAKRSRENKENWNKLKQKWDIPEKYTDSGFTELQTKPNERLKQNVLSVVTNSKIEYADNSAKQYTGTKVIGIALMHKSNAVPIFSNEEAKDVSKMRR